MITASTKKNWQTIAASGYEGVRVKCFSGRKHDLMNIGKVGVIVFLIVYAK